MSTPSSRPSPTIASVVARVVLFVIVSILAGAVVAASAAPLVTGIGVATKAASDEFEALPLALSQPKLPQQSVILASDGQRLATIYYQNRIEVPLTQVAPAMRQAIVAVEDSRFYEHNGFDLRGFVRAAASNASGGQVQGGSTITQQYVKQVLINSAKTPEEVAEAQARTLSRKIRELRYALAIEKQFSKDEILERYLNIAYFGAGAYGVEAAAQRYFSTSANDLTLSQAATLAGIVQQPTRYDPLRDAKASRYRRDQVLSRMVDVGYVTSVDATAARKHSVKSLLRPSDTRNGCTSSWAPFFCEYVINVMRTNPIFGKTPADREALLREGGLIIRTTLDAEAQAGALDAVTSHIPIEDPSKKLAAISMVQPGTGKIIAMAQNRKWGTKGRGNTTYNFNVGTRLGGSFGAQSGSTFKIFTLAAALDQGISPYESLPAPARATFKGFRNCTTGAKFPSYTVNNSTGTSSPMNMLSGSALSVNTFFMALERETGICDPAAVAKSTGLTQGNGKLLEQVPSFTLGTSLVTPLDMAEAYATFASHGQHCSSIAILSVNDTQGNALDVPSANCKQVIRREVADSVSAILSQVIDGPISSRTGRAMSLGRQAAGKTGTINESAAVWFAGYTPDLAAAVWTGDTRGGYRYPMKNITINGTYYPQVFGSSIPGPIWKQAMLTALDKTPKTRFELQTLYGLSTWSAPVYSPPQLPPANKPDKPKPTDTPEPTASPSP